MGPQPVSRYVFGQLPWYSLLIVLGMSLAILLAGREERRLGLPRDTAVDLALHVIPLGVIGARLYYVLFAWPTFAPQPLSILYIWQGGLAIYGGVLGGIFGAWVLARRKKLSVLIHHIEPYIICRPAYGYILHLFSHSEYSYEYRALSRSVAVVQLIRRNVERHKLLAAYRQLL